MKYRKLTLLATLFTWTFCYATVQERESLVYDGKKGTIEEEPAKPYFKKRHVFFESEVVLPPEYRKKYKPLIFLREGAGTSLSRGYLGSWEVKKGKLYMTGFRAWVRNNVKVGEVDLKYLFPKSNGAVFAKWFSGTLHFQSGKEKLSAWNGHITIHEKLVVLQITNGKITKAEEYLYPKNIDVMNKMLSKKWVQSIDVRKEKHQ